MTIRKWVILAAFVLGALVGGALVFKTKPNTIRLQVRANHKLYVYAKNGDHIHWLGQGGKHPTVTFRTGPGYPGPCIGNNAGIKDCVVNADYGSFTYACDSGTPCIDPGVDGGPSTGFKEELLEFLKKEKNEDGEVKAVPPPRAADDPGGPLTPQLTCSNGKIYVDPQVIVASPKAMIQLAKQLER
jgi:hypothetical protein